MEYRLVTTSKPETLTEHVNQLISAGWTPLGGVAISISESPDYLYHNFAQAMIRDLVTPAPGPLIVRSAEEVRLKARILDFTPDRETGLIDLHLEAITHDRDVLEALIQQLRQLVVIVQPLDVILSRSSAPAE